jgi:hypothetical protein
VVVVVVVVVVVMVVVVLAAVMVVVVLVVVVVVVLRNGAFFFLHFLAWYGVARLEASCLLCLINTTIRNLTPLSSLRCVACVHLDPVAQTCTWRRWR